MSAFCTSPSLSIRAPQSPKRCRRQSPICCVASPYAPAPLESVLRDAVAKLMVSEGTFDPAAISIADTTVGPGQLNEHYRLTASDEVSFLCKVSRRGGEEAFHGEALALKLLAESCQDNESLFVNVPLAVSSIDTGLRAYTILPWIDFAPFGSAIPSVQKALGAGLAKIHMQSVEKLRYIHENRFGFPVTTWLGAASQDNDWSAPGDWLGFFVSQRLRPRLKDALEKFGEEWGTSNENVLALTTLGSRVCDVQALQPLFEDCVVSPALLHGDLFMGNAGSHGKVRRACIYDAA